MFEKCIKLSYVIIYTLSKMRHPSLPHLCLPWVHCNSLHKLSWSHTHRDLYFFIQVLRLKQVPPQRTTYTHTHSHTHACIVHYRVWEIFLIPLIGCLITNQWNQYSYSDIFQFFPSNHWALCGEQSLPCLIFIHGDICEVYALNTGLKQIKGILKVPPKSK